MKIIVIPDLHGESYWSEILNGESFDKVIFLGDYLDSPHETNGNEELANLNAIIDNKKKHPEQFFLLIGNHEYHYTTAGIGVNERSPRFQPAYADEFRAALFENRELFQVAHKHDQYLFTHAGVTESWLKNYSGNRVYDSIDNTVNEVWRTNAEAFGLTETGKAKGWGDDTLQSPIWVRPGSLQADSRNLKKEIIQIVGHTPQHKIQISNPKEQRYFFVDTFRSSKEYLIINNGYASVRTTVKAKSSES